MRGYFFTKNTTSAACRSRNFCRAATSLPACPACSEHSQKQRALSELIETGQTSSHPDQLDHLVTVGCHATWRCDPARLQDAAKTHGELAVLRNLAISFTMLRLLPRQSISPRPLAGSHLRSTSWGPRGPLGNPGPMAQTCSCKVRKHLRINQNSFNRDPHPHRIIYDDEHNRVGDNPKMSYSIS